MVKYKFMVQGLNQIDGLPAVGPNGRRRTLSVVDDHDMSWHLHGGSSPRLFKTIANARMAARSETKQYHYHRRPDAPRNEFGWALGPWRPTADELDLLSPRGEVLIFHPSFLPRMVLDESETERSIAERQAMLWTQRLIDLDKDGTGDTPIINAKDYKRAPPRRRRQLLVLDADDDPGAPDD